MGLKNYYNMGDAHLESTALELANFDYNHADTAYEQNYASLVGIVLSALISASYIHQIYDLDTQYSTLAM